MASFGAEILYQNILSASMYGSTAGFFGSRGITTTSGSVYNQYYGMNLGEVVIEPKIAAAKPLPPTNLDWLNKRVDELRVRL